jgi:hypothetical protein
MFWRGVAYRRQSALAQQLVDNVDFPELGADNRNRPDLLRKACVSDLTCRRFRG